MSRRLDLMLLQPPPSGATIPRVRSSPLISILLPVRDAGSTLNGCLNSLVSQSLEDWECLAIDDHSVDDSRELLRSWARRERRIQLFALDETRGIVAALEKARREARAPLLARQDADDISHPQRLERQLEEMLRDPDLGVLGCRTEVGTVIGPGMQRYLDWLDRCIDSAACRREIWVECPIAHPTAVVRAELLDEVGGYRDFGWPEDYDLWLRIHRFGRTIRNLCDRLYVWNDRAERMSRCDQRYSAASFLRCRLHHLRRYLAEQRITRPLVVWGAGRDGGRLARGWEAECSLPGPAAPPIVAFVDIDSAKIGRRRHGREIFAWDQIRDRWPNAFVLAAVGVEGARELIRAQLTDAEYREGEDFLCLH